jgi:hypothetical protein
MRFLPAINEELGATAVLGTQRVEADPERTCDGVFAHVVRQGARASTAPATRSSTAMRTARRRTAAC